MDGYPSAIAVYLPGEDCIDVQIAYGPGVYGSPHLPDDLLEGLALDILAAARDKRAAAAERQAG